jgi:hypothetical protein
MLEEKIHQMKESEFNQLKLIIEQIILEHKNDLKEYYSISGVKQTVREWIEYLINMKICLHHTDIIHNELILNKYRIIKFDYNSYEILYNWITDRLSKEHYFDDKEYFKQHSYSGSLWKSNSQQDFVYIIKCGDYVKIGKSMNPELRKNTLQNATPFPLEILFYSPRFIEEDLHKKFAKYHHSNEWFIYSDEIKNFIIENRLLNLRE